MFTKWKYMTQQFSTEGLSDETIVSRRQQDMTLMGEYGWELVSANVYRSPDTGLDVLILFYKKPVADVPPPPPSGARR